MKRHALSFIVAVIALAGVVTRAEEQTPNAAEAANKPLPATPQEIFRRSLGGLLPTPTEVQPTYYIASTNVVVSVSEKGDAVWAFSKITGEWTKQDVSSPPDGELRPVVDDKVAALQVGQTIYAYGAQLGRWDVLRIPEGQQLRWSIDDEIVLVTAGKDVYTFANSTGKWSSPGDPAAATSSSADTPKVYALKRAKAATLAENLQSLFPNAVIVADQRTNSLLVACDPAHADEIEKVVKRIDEPGDEQSVGDESSLQSSAGSVQIIRLKHANATVLVPLLSSLFQGRAMFDQRPVFVAEKETNSLLIRADEERLESIRNVVHKLDQPAAVQSPGQSDMGGSGMMPGMSEMMSGAPGMPGSDRGATGMGSGVMPPGMGPPGITQMTSGGAMSPPGGNVDALADKYRQAERRAAEIAQGRRRPGLGGMPGMAPGGAFGAMGGFGGPPLPAQSSARTSLRREVEAAFEARQQLQRAELAELQQRLVRIQNMIEARERIKDKIIDRRVEELLDPNLRWDQPTETNSATSLGQKVESAVADRESTLAALQGNWVLSRTRNDPQPQTLKVDKSTWRFTDAGGETLTGTARLESVGRRRFTLEFVEDNGAQRIWNGSYEIDENVLAIQFEVETRQGRGASTLARPDETLWHWSGLYQRAGGVDMGSAPRRLDAAEARALYETLRQRQELVEKSYQNGEASLLECLTAAKELAEAEAAVATSAAELRKARQQQVDLLKHMRATVEELLKTGEANQADVLSVEAELLKAEAQLMRGAGGLQNVPPDSNTLSGTESHFGTGRVLQPASDRPALAGGIATTGRGTIRFTQSSSFDPGSQAKPNEAAISGQVLDQDEQPIPGAMIRIERMRGLRMAEIAQATSDAEGRFRISELQPGAVELSVHEGGDLAIDAKLMLTPGVNGVHVLIWTTEAAREMQLKSDNSPRRMGAFNDNQLDESVSSKTARVMLYFPTAAGNFTLSPVEGHGAGLLAVNVENLLNWSEPVSVVAKDQQVANYGKTLAGPHLVVRMQPNTWFHREPTRTIGIAEMVVGLDRAGRATDTMFVIDSDGNMTKYRNLNPARLVPPVDKTSANEASALENEQFWELMKLQGKWNYVSTEREGKVEKVNDRELIIYGTNLQERTSRGTQVAAAKLRVNATGQLIMHSISGGDGSIPSLNTPVTTTGFVNYDITGDTLKYSVLHIPTSDLPESTREAFSRAEALPADLFNLAGKKGLETITLKKAPAENEQRQP